MEPPGPYLCGRPAAADGVELNAGPLRHAAVAAATVLAVTSSGEVVLLAVVLGVAAADLLAGAVALWAGLALAVRWGSSSLDAVGGAQAVLGPGATVGPAAAIAATWGAAAALVLASPRGWAALAFGAAAALGVAGPSPSRAGDLAIRVAGVLAGVACAVVVSRRGPPPAARRAALALSAAALALALVA